MEREPDGPLVLGDRGASEERLTLLVQVADLRLLQRPDAEGGPVDDEVRSASAQSRYRFVIIPARCGNARPDPVFPLLGIRASVPVMVSVLATVVALAAAIVCFVMGSLFRLGRLRGMARYYRDSEFPAFARNCGISMLPWSVVFFLWFLTGFFTSRSELIAGAFAVMSLLGMAFGILITQYPPNWLKPGWLRRGEVWNERGTGSGRS